MSLPDRNNPYSFDDFLEWRESVDYYVDDPFLQQVVKTYCGDDWRGVDAAAKEMSPRVSQRWRKLADDIAVPEKRPFLVHYDAHNHRIDRIVRPTETELMEREVFGEGLFSDSTPAWVKLTKMYLLYQNGEACIACPVTCTEGLVKLLEKYADCDETRAVLEHCKEGIDGDFGIGAQYLSEIQAGSDVPANLVEAVHKDGTWRLYGQKFFCSATHADYAVVTAKPKGSEDIAIFLVPSWLSGDKEKERRNGYTIDRIKWKMGTSELTTAEMTFDGAVGYPVGPLERGLANVVGIVLTYSRLTVGLWSAALMTRAAREAMGYARFRTAFGQPVKRFPMLAGQLRKLEADAKRTTAGAFKLYRQFLDLEDSLGQKLNADGPEEALERRFEVREMIMLQKIVTAEDATRTAQLAMSVFGGHGVMEDFSALPRLFRDSAINELWEGPRNVLLSQVHRDCRKMAQRYPPTRFVGNLLAGHPDGAFVERLAGEFSELVESLDLLEMNDSTLDACRAWERACEDLVHGYQEVALKEVGNSEG